jgi:hypothetical protein
LLLINLSKKRKETNSKKKFKITNLIFLIWLPVCLEFSFFFYCLEWMFIKILSFKSCTSNTVAPQQPGSVVGSHRLSGDVLLHSAGLFSSLVKLNNFELFTPWLNNLDNLLLIFGEIVISFGTTGMRRLYVS